MNKKSLYGIYKPYVKKTSSLSKEWIINYYR